MSDATTARTSPAPAASLHMIEAMRAELGKQPTEWMLFSPDGRMWTGDQRAMARVLFQNIDVTTLFKDQP